MSAGARKILLDLSLLGTPSTSRGIGRYARELALGLARQTKDSALWQVQALAELPLVGAPRLSSDVADVIERLETRRGRTKAGWASRVRLALGRATSSAKADVVHSLDPDATPLLSLSCPRVVTCHHVESNSSPEEWHGVSATVARTDLRRFARADRIVAISRATAHELITRLNVPRDKIDVVHNGVNLQLWRSERNPDDAARRVALGLSEKPYLLGVGSVDERKNVDGIFRGLRRARELIGSQHLGLTWAGHISKQEEDQLRHKAAQAGLGADLRPVGYVSDEDLAALYRGATALAFVSRREGFGYPVVEAMACGCPVITSNCSSLVEVAANAACTVDPEDTEAIGDAIVLLADDNAERRRLAAAGLQRAKGFSVQSMVDRTLGSYEAALLGPRARMPSRPI